MRTELNPENEEIYHRAAEAFGAISSEFRVEILHFLSQEQNPVQFSDISEAVGEPRSGRLTYHLNELSGTFIVKVDGGYRLSRKGNRIISSIIANRYFEESGSDQTTLNGRCLNCSDRELTLRKTTDYSEVYCGSCDIQLFKFGTFPPTAWESRDSAVVPHALHWRVTCDTLLTIQDICYDCYSPLNREVLTIDDPSKWSYFYGNDIDRAPNFNCETCTNWVPLRYWDLIWFYPSLESVRDSFNIDPMYTPIWEIGNHVTDLKTEFISEDPYRVEVTFEDDGKSCSVVFNDQHRVTRVNRRSTF